MDVDHATLNRWVIGYSPRVAEEARKRKATTSRSWRVDETYLKVNGRWMYYYRAVDKYGGIRQFLLDRQCDPDVMERIMAYEKKA